ncbi:MAG: hypothetical protein RBR97_19460 [Bacteroidales bacterium]|jgi:hypothetical protein|nr:hypothetical protein [Bacteroidales bacterium]
MFNFLKTGQEFHRLAKSFTGIDALIKELSYNIANRTIAEDEVVQELYALIYFTRVGIWDRLDNNNWPLDKNIIIVPSISNKRISINLALKETHQKILNLSIQYNIEDDFEEIMEKGTMFKIIATKIPDNLKGAL